LINFVGFFCGLIQDYEPGLDFFVLLNIFDYFFDIFEIVKVVSFGMEVKDETKICSFLSDFLDMIIFIILCNDKLITSNVDYLLKKSAILKLIEWLKIYFKL
jgi:hypothetical protein